MVIRRRVGNEVEGWMYNIMYFPPKDRSQVCHLILAT